MINKFKNIKDYYTYLNEQKPISSENDPWGEEEWEDENITEIELDGELKDFVDHLSNRIVINTHFGGNETNLEDVNRNDIIRKNPDILLKFKEIMKYLDDNFYTKRTGAYLNWAPKINITVSGDEYHPSNSYKKDHYYDDIEDLGYILKEKLDLNVDEHAMFDLEDYYVFDGYELALYWIMKKTK